MVGAMKTKILKLFVRKPPSLSWKDIDMPFEVNELPSLTYRQLKDYVNKLTEEQLNQNVVAETVDLYQEFTAIHVVEENDEAENVLSVGDIYLF